MGKEPTQPEAAPALDKDSRKRLEKLAAQWDKSPASYWGENLSPPDLRLLLEHFAPLQALIRALASPPAAATWAASTACPTPAATATPLATPLATPPAASPAEHTTASLPAALRAQLEQAAQTALAERHAALQARDAALAECDAAQAERDRALAERDAERSARHSAQGEAAAAVRSRNAALAELDAAQRQLQQTQRELAQCRSQIERAQTSAPALDTLRRDPELARSLGLDDLPPDPAAALTRTVAVLAQRDSLERLWAALKARCEASQCPASTAEAALLESALAWYNHNWRSRPYRLLAPAASAPYQFEQHLRSQHSPGGETIAALLLPGIADASGKPICKALVQTRT